MFRSMVPKEHIYYNLDLPILQKTLQNGIYNKMCCNAASEYGLRYGLKQCFLYAKTIFLELGPTCSLGN